MNEALSKAIAALERIAETNASKHGTTPMMLERCLSTAREALSALLALQEARPVAYAYGTGLHWADQFPDTDEAEATALYAHPQPAQQDARDAERYRWLRQFPTHFGTPIWGIYGAGLPLDRVFIDRAERLDAAIDAALAAAKEKQ